MRLSSGRGRTAVHMSSKQSWLPAQDLQKIKPINIPSHEEWLMSPCPYLRSRGQLIIGGGESAFFKVINHHTPVDGLIAMSIGAAQMRLTGLVKKYMKLVGLNLGVKWSMNMIKIH